MTVRVRYAPSPTGNPHVGNIRTALFNWLFARHHGGKFIVRIEDTDQERLVPGAEEQILESLRWLGLDWDEGPEVDGPYAPYHQSKRLATYREAADRLIANGDAYTCTCSPDRLDGMRKAQQQRGEPPGYDRRCRNLTAEERAHEVQAANGRCVVRFAVPLDGETRFTDLIRDEVVFQNKLLDDFVIMKSDGFPTYHLASVCDDHLMQISHTMRAEEWLPSTPRHVLLYGRLGWTPPAFAHMPMILGPDRSKLSKRHGATSTLEYRDQGYLPEAMVNFLALLGWSLDDSTEIIDIDTLVKHFAVERVSKASAIFNIEKLQWMNGMYIRKLPPEELARRVIPFLQGRLPADAQTPTPEYVSAIVPLVQERLKVLSEAPELTSFFFETSLKYDAKTLIQKGMDRDTTLRALERTLDVTKALSDWSIPSIEATLRPLTEELGLKPAQLFQVIRVATTSRTAAPPLFETMHVLGRERCLRRLDEALAHLDAAKV